MNECLKLGRGGDGANDRMWVILWSASPESNHVLVWVEGVLNRSGKI